MDGKTAPNQLDPTRRRLGGLGRRPPLRTAACALLPLLLAVTAAGCGTKRLSGACGIVVDGSGSGLETATGFEAGKAIDQYVPGFLRHAGCRQLAFAPIGRSSGSSPCRVLPLDLDPDASGNVNRDKLREQRRTKAVDRAHELLGCERKRDAGWSDVFGGLQRIAEARPEPNGKYTVLVISDFINYPDDSLDPATGMKIGTAAERTAAINDLAQRGRIADLHGVDLYSVGFGAQLGGGTRYFPPFRQFWHQLLENEAKVAHFYDNRAW